MSAAREELLIKSWLSHDARWFNAVAGEFGLEAANRANQDAARAAARVEAIRAARHIGIDRVGDAAQCVRALDALVALFGAPAGLLEYETAIEDARTFSIKVKRCFAHENVARAGIADRYDCGIFARVQGWLEGLGCGHEVAPPLRGCLKAQGLECTHRVRINPRGDA
jgi:hypothetical protein